MMGISSHHPSFCFAKIHLPPRGEGSDRGMQEKYLPLGGKVAEQSEVG